MPMPPMEEKLSPADVCLERTHATLDCKDCDEIEVVIERRAWVCPWCEESTEYLVVNGSTVKGNNGSSLYHNGKHSNCCGKGECVRQQRLWHEEICPSTRTKQEKQCLTS